MLCIIIYYLLFIIYYLLFIYLLLITWFCSDPHTHVVSDVRAHRGPTIINFLPVDEMTQEEAQKSVFHVIRKDGVYTSTQVITTMKKHRRTKTPKRIRSISR